MVGSEYYIPEDSGDKCDRQTDHTTEQNVAIGIIAVGCLCDAYRQLYFSSDADLVANISGTDSDIDKRKTALLPTTPPALGQKNW